MKTLFLALSLICYASTILPAQHDQFNDKFRPGSYTDAEGREHEGLLSVVLLQKTKLRFKAETDGEVVKLKMEEVARFTLEDSIHFVNITDFEAYNALGKLMSIKYSFARVITTGDTEAFYVYISSHNPINQAMAIIPHLVLRKGVENISVPIMDRVRKKKFLSMRETLVTWLELNGVNRGLNEAKAAERESGFLEVLGAWQEPLN